MLNLTYTLDATGNRTAISANGITTLFGVDAINELVSAQLGPLTGTWAYDAVGNRTKQVLPTGVTSYVYDPADRLLQAGTRLFTYDRNGNEVSATTGINGTPVLYTYDAANQLTSARAGTKINSSFSYDGDGNRVAQTTRKGTYAYVNDVVAQLPVVLQESGPDGQITYARGIGLIEEFSSSFNYFYHPDGLGSTIGLTNSRGEIEAAYIYDAWGNAILSTSDDVGTRNKFRFTGEALDPETQLYFLRARAYDAASGRFLSVDPLGLTEPLLPQPRQSAYVYVLNNPLRYIDPFGLSANDSGRVLGISISSDELSTAAGEALTALSKKSASAGIVSVAEDFLLQGALDAIKNWAQNNGHFTLANTAQDLSILDNPFASSQSVAPASLDLGTKVGNVITGATNGFFHFLKRFGVSLNPADYQNLQVQ